MYVCIATTCSLFQKLYTQRYIETNIIPYFTIVYRGGMFKTVQTILVKALARRSVFWKSARMICLISSAL